MENLTQRQYIFGALFVFANKLQLIGDRLDPNITMKQWLLVAVLPVRGKGAHHKRACCVYGVLPAKRQKAGGAAFGKRAFAASEGSKGQPANPPAADRRV